MPPNVFCEYLGIAPAGGVYVLALIVENIYREAFLASVGSKVEHQPKLAVMYPDLASGTMYAGRRLELGETSDYPGGKRIDPSADAANTYCKVSFNSAALVA
jgi:hypothetical protein